MKKNMQTNTNRKLTAAIHSWSDIQTWKLNLGDDAQQFHDCLQERLRKVSIHMRHLEQALAIARKNMERECQHVYVKDWENRDARSRWYCKHCGKCR